MTSPPPPILLRLSLNQPTPTHQLDLQYYVQFPTKGNSLRTGREFQALDRSCRQYIRTLTFDNTTPFFPRRRFNKMSLTDAEPRTHVKTIALTNRFLDWCNNNAKNEPWWLLFFNEKSTVHHSTTTDTLLALGKRQQAKRWNQYFTQTREAQLLMKATLALIKNKPVTVLMEPAAGNGSLCHLFPSYYQCVSIDIDPELCALYGWKCANFLTQTRTDLALQNVPTSAVCVVTNPPFVLHGQGDNGDNTGSSEIGKVGEDGEKSAAAAAAGKRAADERDGGLAAQFVHHALTFADTVCMILPARFAQQHACIAPDSVDSWLVGNTMPSQFDLGQDHYKVITQPTVICIFCRRNGIGKSQDERKENACRNEKNN